MNTREPSSCVCVHRVYNGKDKSTAVCGNYAKSYDNVSSATIKCKSGHRIDAVTLIELISPKGFYEVSVSC